MIIIRAYCIEAFIRPMSRNQFAWELSGRLFGVFILAAALIIGIWYPLVSLFILFAIMIVSPLINYFSNRFICEPILNMNGMVFLNRGTLKQ